MSLDGIRTLLVEDDRGIVRALKPMLGAEGADVTVAMTGREALERLEHDRFDLVILDLGLPDMDGKQLIPAIRERSDSPIVVLSARGREQDRIEVLDLGCDDFVAKPYSIGELLARLRAALRRRTLSHPSGERIRLDGLEVDLVDRRAFLQGEQIDLSRREHALLLFFARHPGVVVTHRQIIDAVWGVDAEVDNQFVRVLVGQLRQRVEAEPSRPRLIKTVAGSGYRLAVEPRIGPSAAPAG
jgi:two-component system KDP operon response regulator KdpE